MPTGLSVTMEKDISTNSLFRFFDWITVLLYVALVLEGWFSIMGATYNFGDPISLDFSAKIGKQMLWIGLAWICAFSILKIDDKIYDTFSNFIYICMMALLLITPFIASRHRGSMSWIDLGPFNMQPAEFAKTATALALSKLMGTYGFNITKGKNFLQACAIVFIPVILIIMQRETGSALVYLSFFLAFYREGMSGSILFVGMAAVVYFVVGLRYDELAMDHMNTSVGAFVVMVLIWLFTVILDLIYDSNKQHARIMFLGGTVLLAAGYAVSFFIVVFDLSWILLGICVGCILYLVFQSFRNRLPRLLFVAAFCVGSMAMHYSTDYVFNHIMEPHQQSRVRVLLGLEHDYNGAGYNVRQSEIAIGSGGIFGKGFLNGTQTKLKYVPEQDTDFIFCTIGEEWGFFGSSLVLLVFLVFILRLIHVAERQKFAMYRIYGYCVVGIFIFHLFINIGMVIGLTPVIGIPLPFFSYGGSSLWGFTFLLFIFLRMDAGRNRNNG